jgi:DNA-binding LacI/PurR family transcriptional regulator
VNRKTTRLEDLARKAGVSVSTASRALNDSPAVNMQTKQAIWKLAREMDYPFRQHMPAGPIGAKANISIVVPRPQGRPGRLSDPFFFELLSGIGDAARERDCDVHISHVAPSSFDDLHVAMTTNRADGVIFVGQSTLHSAFNRLAETETRFVVWGAELPEQNYCSIGSNNPLGGKRATRHLLRLGRRRVVFLGDTEAPEAMQRYRGYREAVEEEGGDADPALYKAAHFNVESAEACVDSLMAEAVAFDGIVAASDVIALGAMRALHRAGRRVPEDVSVVGYDNVAFARYAIPALTTIDQDTATAGRLMISKLLDSSGPSRSERLATELIIRESTGG